MGRQSNSNHVGTENPISHDRTTLGTDKPTIRSEDSNTKGDRSEGHHLSLIYVGRYQRGTSNTRHVPRQHIQNWQENRPHTESQARSTLTTFFDHVPT